jgi:hypothetical protein
MIQKSDDFKIDLKLTCNKKMDTKTAVSKQYILLKLWTEQSK